MRILKTSAKKGSGSARGASKTTEQKIASKTRETDPSEAEAVEGKLP
jgi:hypothetical protein